MSLWRLLGGRWGRAQRPALAAGDELLDVVVGDEGWLRGPGVELDPSDPSWGYRELDTDDGRPLAIVWHYTATDWGTARAMARRRRKPYRPGTDRPASWHVTVTHDGVLLQQLSVFSGGWHCARGRIEGHRVNLCAVGVELEGHGDRFPAAQIAAAERLVSALARVGVSRRHARHGHRDFDPHRRRDPGEVWTALLDPMLNRVYAGSE